MKNFLRSAALLLVFNLASAQEKLNNQSIISLTQAKLGTKLIVSKVQDTDSDYDLSAQGILDLKAGKVDDDVVVQMLIISDDLPVVKNEDVIKMTQGKVSKDIIIQKINLSECKFDTSTEGLIALKTAKVPEAITKVMMDPSAGVKGGSANLISEKLPPHPQDLAAPKSLPRPGIYYEQYTPKKDYAELEPSTTNQNKSGGAGEYWANRASHGFSGKSNRAGLSGTSSNFVIKDARPVFYFYLPQSGKDFNEASESTAGGVSSPNDFVLVKVKVTKTGREVQLSKSSNLGTESGFTKGTVTFRFKKISDRLYKVYFDGDIPAGEYAFYYNKGSEQRSSVKLFDFALKNNIVEKRQ